MDVNKYIRDKIAANKDLYLHEDQSHIHDAGTSAFVISNDKHRFESAVLTTGGLPDDHAEAKSIIDHRFSNIVGMLSEAIKRFGGK